MAGPVVRTVLSAHRSYLRIERLPVLKERALYLITPAAYLLRRQNSSLSLPYALRASALSLSVKSLLNHGKELVVLFLDMVLEISNKRIDYTVKYLVLLKAAAEGMKK